MGASRCVYAVGSRYAIKYEYEYGHPDERYSNKKEAYLTGKFPQMLPWTIEVTSGSLLVRQAAYTVEDLVQDISENREHQSGDSRYERLYALVRGVLEWAAWIVEFAAEHGLHLDDSSPPNAGYDPHEAK